MVARHTSSGLPAEGSPSAIDRAKGKGGAIPHNSPDSTRGAPTKEHHLLRRVQALAARDDAFTAVLSTSRFLKSGISPPFS